MLVLCSAPCFQLFVCMLVREGPGCQPSQDTAAAVLYGAETQYTDGLLAADSSAITVVAREQ